MNFGLRHSYLFTFFKKKMKKNESVQNDVHIEIFQNILEDDKLLIDNIIQALETLGNDENTG